MFVCFGVFLYYQVEAICVTQDENLMSSPEADSNSHLTILHLHGSERWVLPCHVMCHIFKSVTFQFGLLSASDQHNNSNNTSNTHEHVGKYNAKTFHLLEEYFIILYMSASANTYFARVYYKQALHIQF